MTEYKWTCRKRNRNQETKQRRRMD